MAGGATSGAAARAAHAAARVVRAPLRPPAHGPRRSVAASAGLGDWIKSIMDFDSWAPKSSRIWRLQQYQYPESDSELLRGGGGSGGASDEVVSDESLRVLRERLSRLRDSDGGSSSGSSGSFSSSSGGGSAAAVADGDGGGEEGAATRSFTDADDGEISGALQRRLTQVAEASGDEDADGGAEGAAGAAGGEEAALEPLTGQEIQDLLMAKYGRRYDLSFVRRNLGPATFCSLNVMWIYMGQRSFQLTPEQYDEKLEGVAALVNALGQTAKVRAFLQAPAKSQRGLPRRPVVGTAISIQLDLTPAQVEEWFGAGYQ